MSAAWTAVPTAALDLMLELLMQHRPVAAEVAIADLRREQERVLLSLAGPKRDRVAWRSRAERMERWGWSRWAVEKLLADEDLWGDPRRAEEWAAYRAARTSQRNGSATASERQRNGSGTAADRQPTGSAERWNADE